MNTYNFIPTLFDATRNGVYTFQSVLAYHKSIENLMPVDGLVWLCEHPNLDKLRTKKEEISNEMNVIEQAMQNQPYAIWTILDRRLHLLRTRLQLVTLCINTTTYMGSQVFAQAVKNYK
jgi:hypothetical protein